jgi:hypothetical protein
MNRRSFLSMIGLAPFAGAAIASAAVASPVTEHVVNFTFDSADSLIAELEHEVSSRTLWTHVGNVTEWSIQPICSVCIDSTVSWTQRGGET